MRRRTLRVQYLENRLTPAIWNGGGADNNWMTPQNWVGDVAPVAGDVLEFPAGALQTVNVNNFPTGTSFAALSVTGPSYQLSGNAIALGAGVNADIPGGASELMLEIDGAGGLMKSGGGTLVLSGANTYSGITTVSGGLLEARTPTGFGATGTGNETMVSDGATAAVRNPSNGAAITVGESFTLNGQGLMLPTGPLGALRSINGPVVFSGPLTLAGDSRIIAGENSELTVTQGIGELGGPRALSLDGTRMTFASTAFNSYTGPTDVATNVLFFGRGVSPLNVGDTGTLQGTGTVGSVQANGAGVVAGTLDASGLQSRQVLTLRGLNLGTDSNLTFYDTSTGSDRLIVDGTVQLAGTLSFLAASHFTIAPGTRILLVDNDGTDPVQGAFSGLPEGTQFNFQNVTMRITYRGGDGNDVELIAAGRVATSAVGAGPGGAPTVNVYDGAGGLMRAITAYDPSFRGGVRVATGDVNGDGVPDVVTAPGPGGGPDIRVWDGVTGAMIREFNAYDPNFRGGVNIATADINGDGKADIITGAGAGGGPHVEVFNGATGHLDASFLAYDPTFFGGVTVAGFDARMGSGGNLMPGIVVTGAGPGGGPHVEAFTVTPAFVQPPSLVASFFPYDPAFHGGVNVAAHGPVPAGGGTAGLQIVTAPMKGGGPDVRISDFSGKLLGAFMPYAPNFFGGVNVAMLPIGPGGANAIVTGAGQGGGPHVELWSLVNEHTASLLRSLLAFDQAFAGGVSVG
jgi:fibronectin-binding autotransporter adhesin